MPVAMRSRWLLACTVLMVLTLLTGSAFAVGHGEDSEGSEYSEDGAVTALREFPSSHPLVPG